MKLSRRLIGATIVLLVLSVSGAGVYVRVNQAKTADAAGADSTNKDLPSVASADSAFDPNAPVPVEGEEVQFGDMVMTVTAAGQAASRRPTVIKSQVGGVIKSIRVNENSSVGVGDILIQIDDTEYQMNLAEAKANLRQAQAAYRVDMIDNDRVTDAAVRAQREQAARDKAGLERSELAVQRQEINLARTNIKSPFQGRIANLKVVLGQHVGPGEELLTVQEMDPIRVDVQVLEGAIGNIAPGRPAEVTFAAFPGEIFRGTVETINPIVDNVFRTARVSVRVPNPRGRILPGMYAKVTLTGERLPDRIFVPKDAVIERDLGRTLVFVFEPDSPGSDIGRAKWRYVTRGKENDRYRELVPDDQEGVHKGEIVLTKGHYSLTHDGRVRLVQNALKEGGRPE